jgi:hypothetical protein
LGGFWVGSLKNFKIINAASRIDYKKTFLNLSKPAEPADFKISAEPGTDTLRVI